MFRVESNGYWFITDAETRQIAKRDGIREFGSGNVTSVTIASQEDIDYFRNLKGCGATKCGVY